MKPDKRLADTKVYVAGKSKEIQEKVFQLGYRWGNISSQTTLDRLSFPFLFFHESGYITYGNDMDKFLVHNNKEVTADYILSLEPEPECPFKPFDKVLVRDGDEFEWRPKLFSYMDDDRYVTLDYDRFAICIPYEGNEHLAFTTDSPNQ